MRTRIKDIAQKKGIKQADFARMLNIGLPAVKAMYSAESLSLARLEEVAKILDVPVWHLICPEEDIPSPATTHVCPHCGKPINITID